jgi:hypothetical protein
MGRPREAHVRRSMRTCPIHGVTEFAEYPASTGGAMKYICMLCSAERAAAQRQAKRDGTHVSRVRMVTIPPEKMRAMCTNCRQEKPVTGICDNCD